MESVRSYYEGRYADDQLQTDLSTRNNRLVFCLDPSLKGNVILDVGCGPGVQLAYLVPDNAVYGIDISSVALAHAHRNGYRTTLANLDGHALPYVDATFDIVVCTDLLEHLFSPQDLVQEIRRVLKPDGRAIISVPNHFDFFSRLRLLRGSGLVLPYHRKCRSWNYYHIRFFTLADFLDLLREEGFAVAQTYYDCGPADEWAIVLLLTDREWMRGWTVRHRSRPAFSLAVNIVAACARLALLPRMLARVLPGWFPTLFSRHFLVACVKKPSSDT